MKYAACGLVAAFLALMAHGAVPTGAEGWYTPAGGFTKQSGSGTVYWWDDGKEQSAFVSVDAFGKISGGITVPDGSPELRTAYEALVKACEIEAYSMKQDEAIETIGRNLDEMVNGGLFVDYVDTDGKKAAVSVQYKGTGKDAAKPSATPTRSLDAGKVKVDKTSIWKLNDGTLTLVWPKADGLHAATPGGWRRFTPGGGGGGVPPDGISLGTVEAGGATNLQVRGFAAQAACGANLHDLLAEGTDPDALGHEVLCRVTGGGGRALHYLPLGGSKFAEPDGETVEAHAPDGGKRTLRVKPGDAGKYMRTNAGGDGVEWSAAVASVEAESGSAVRAETDAETGKVTLSFENPGIEVVDTMGTSHSGARLKFEPDSGTGLRVNASKDGDTLKVYIGVYYQ